MIVTSVQIKTVKTQKHLYCPVFTEKSIGICRCFFQYNKSIRDLLYFTCCEAENFTIRQDYFILRSNISFFKEMPWRLKWAHTAFCLIR